MRELSLFTGAGGGVLAGKLLGWETIGYVEKNEYCQRVIAARIRDGIFDDAPIFGDVRTFNRDGYADAYSGLVDVLTAGFPCQPFSVAGRQDAGRDDRNCWPETAEAIRRIRPIWCFLENVPGLLAARHGYFGVILGEMAELGYDVEWEVLSAADVGAPHLRKRLWIAARLRISDAERDELWEQRQRDGQRECGEPGAAELEYNGADGALADADSGRREVERVAEHSGVEGARGNFAYGRRKAGRGRREKSPIYLRQLRSHVSADQTVPAMPDMRNDRQRHSNVCHKTNDRENSWWRAEPDVLRVAHGVAARTHRLRAIGNGQVPLVAAVAWLRLRKRLEISPESA